MVRERIVVPLAEGFPGTVYRLILRDVEGVAYEFHLHDCLKISGRLETSLQPLTNCLHRRAVSLHSISGATGIEEMATAIKDEGWNYGIRQINSQTTGERDGAHSDH
jgi:hypothetical protein